MLRESSSDTLFKVPKILPDFVNTDIVAFNSFDEDINKEQQDPKNLHPIFKGCR